MEPSSHFTPAGETIKSSWNQYLEKRDEKSLKQLIGSIKTCMPDLRSEDLPLFNSIHETIQQKSLVLTELDEMVAQVVSKLMPSGPMAEMPLELVLQMLPEFTSKQDFKSVSEVSKLWRALSHNPAKLADMVNRAQFRIPLNVLLGILQSCGNRVNTLNFYRLLSDADRAPSNLTAEKLQRMLSLCPKAQNFFFYNVPSLTSQMLLDHFTSDLARDAVNKIGIIGDIGMQNVSPDVEQKLKESCPKLQRFYVDTFHIRPPPGLLNLLDRGKDVFEYLHLVEQVGKKFVDIPGELPMDIMELLPLDELAKLSPERLQDLIQNKAEPFFAICQSVQEVNRNLNEEYGWKLISEFIELDDNLQMQFLDPKHSELVIHLIAEETPLSVILEALPKGT